MQTIYHFQRAKGCFDGKNKAHNCRLPGDFIVWLEERFEDDDNIEDAEDFVANSVMSQSEFSSFQFHAKNIFFSKTYVLRYIVWWN